MYKQSTKSKYLDHIYFPVKVDIWVTKEDRIKRMVTVEEWLKENVENNNK